MYNWITLLYNRKEHNIVYHQYFNKINFFKKREERSLSEERPQWQWRSALRSQRAIRSPTAQRRQNKEALKSTRGLLSFPSFLPFPLNSGICAAYAHLFAACYSTVPRVLVVEWRWRWILKVDRTKSIPVSPEHHRKSSLPWQSSYPSFLLFPQFKDTPSWLQIYQSSWGYPGCSVVRIP